MSSRRHRNTQFPDSALTWLASNEITKQTMDFILNKMSPKGIGTKAQQALKLQHEQCKLERKTKSRKQKETEKDRQFAIRQEKKKAKHRGR